MYSHVEPARGSPLRDSSEQAESYHIDLRFQGEPEQSPDNQDQEKGLNDKVVSETGS